MRSPASKSIVSAAKAFADANRLRILLALRTGELCVCELCDALKLSQSTLSTHLQVIRSSGLATSRKQGKWAYYQLTALGRTMTEFVSETFAQPLATDAALNRDQAQLKRRLKLREGDACCVGMGCHQKDPRS